MEAGSCTKPNVTFKTLVWCSFSFKSVSLTTKATVNRFALNNFMNFLFWRYVSWPSLSIGKPGNKKRWQVLSKMFLPQFVILACDLFNDESVDNCKINKRKCHSMPIFFGPSANHVIWLELSRSVASTHVLVVNYYARWAGEHLHLPLFISPLYLVSATCFETRGEKKNRSLIFPDSCDDFPIWFKFILSAFKCRSRFN